MVEKRKKIYKNISGTEQLIPDEWGYYRSIKKDKETDLPIAGRLPEYFAEVEESESASTPQAFDKLMKQSVQEMDKEEAISFEEAVAELELEAEPDILFIPAEETPVDEVDPEREAELAELVATVEPEEVKEIKRIPPKRKPKKKSGK